jgi:hypothetical protein
MTTHIRSYVPVPLSMRVIMKHEVSDSVCRSNLSAWTAVSIRYRQTATKFSTY